MSQSVTQFSPKYTEINWKYEKGHSWNSAIKYSLFSNW